jgi:hypothetical protein
VYHSSLTARSDTVTGGPTATVRTAGTRRVIVKNGDSPLRDGARARNGPLPVRQEPNRPPGGIGHGA